MVFTKLLLENALAIRPCNCEAVSELLLPKVAHCIPVLPSHCSGKFAAHFLKCFGLTYVATAAAAETSVKLWSSLSTNIAIIR